jgi:hypothetical protein
VVHFVFIGEILLTRHEGVVFMDIILSWSSWLIGNIIM